MSFQSKLGSMDDLYQSLIQWDDNLHSFLNTYSTRGNQGTMFEAVTKLFFGLNIIQSHHPNYKKYNSYQLLTGNFDSGYILQENTTKIRNNLKIQKNKQGGDSADIVLVSPVKNHIIAFSSKYWQSFKSIKKLELDSIHTTYIKKYQDKVNTFEISCALKDKNICISKWKRARAGKVDNFNQDLIIDLEDLEDMYTHFKCQYTNKLSNQVFSVSSKPTMKVYFHQMLTILKTKDLIQSGMSLILWDLFCRSGKSFVLLQLIDLMKYKKVLYISSKPTDTLGDMRSKIGEYQEFDHWEYKYLDKTISTVQDYSFNVISIQRLRHKRNLMKIPEFDVVFMDEFHYAGNTDKADTSLFEQLHKYKTPKIFLSATGGKIATHHSIPQDHIISFNVADIQICKNILSNKDLLDKRFGSGLIQDTMKLLVKKGMYSLNYHQSEISTYYREEYPQIKTYTWSGDNGILKEYNNDWGCSMRSTLNIKDGKFEFNSEVQQLFMRLLSISQGRRKTNTQSFLYNIREHQKLHSVCSNVSQRQLIMVYLPEGGDEGIDGLCSLLQEKMKQWKFMEPFKVLIDTGKSPLNDQELKQELYHENDGETEYVLLLCGGKKREGFTEKRCHIEFMLDDVKSSDKYIQTFYRGFTPDKDGGKKWTYVVDVHFQRDLYMKYEMGKQMFKHASRGQRYTLIEKMCGILNPEYLRWDGHREILDLQTNYIDCFKYYIKTHMSLDTFKDIVKEIQDLTYTGDIRIDGKMLKSSTSFTCNIHKNEMSDMNTGIRRERVEVESKCDSDIENDDKVNDTEYLTPQQIQEIVSHIIVFIALFSNDDSGSLEDVFKMVCTENKTIVSHSIINVKEIQDCIYKKLNIDINVKYLLQTIMTSENQDYLKDLNTIYKELQDTLQKCKGDLKQYSQVIYDLFKPTEQQKKIRAEVPTPVGLKQDMLDKVPRDFWGKSDTTILEPCCGKGGFLVDVVDRLMTGLKDEFKTPEDCYKHIVEEQLYFCDIEPLNVEICKMVLDPYKKGYKLNYHIGDTLELDIRKVWKVEGFDLVVGNPPYQRGNGNKGRGNTLWDKFVVKSIDTFIKLKGLLIMVHPQGWRQHNHPCGKKILSRQLLYLNMNNTKKGQQVFGCSTTYDWYVLQNIKPYTTTIIVDYKDVEYTMNISKMTFIPNHSIQQVYDLIDYDNTCGFYKDRSSYGSDKNHLHKALSEEYKYPCVYTINKQNQLSLRYSSTNEKGHFGIIKFIVSNGAGYFKDLKGEYALTEWAYGLPCDVNDMNSIEKCFTSKDFENIVDAVKLTSNRYNYVIIKYFKKDFWKEFI